MAPDIRKARIKWIEKLRFAGMTHSGRALIMDASQAAGGDASAPTPGELLFISLGGCTGIDVVSILNKMRVPFRDLQIEIEGEPVDEHPKIYKWIKITYRFFGVADKEKANRAVKLSQEKYCSISAIVGKSAELVHEVVFEP